MGAFFIMPLALVVVYSFLKAGPYGGILWELSHDAYVQILFEKDFDGNVAFNPAYVEVLLRSVKLAGICTLFCVLLGFPTAYYMATCHPSKRNAWILLVTIPFWTNLLIRTYAWMLVLRTDGLLNHFLLLTGIIKEPLLLLYNDFAVGLGLLYSYLPFMILPIYASLERMDWQMTEAAADLYANRWQTLVRITIPLAMPGIVAGCVLVFIPAIGSFLASDLLGGGKQMMLGNLVQMQFGFSRNWPFGSAVSVILMAIVMLGMMWMARNSRGARL
ncbi:MAG: ABC transporter permease [Proteobacteria bacterium]|nr:ABC transporter permease [Pseudomonadota bacterium]